MKPKDQRKLDASFPSLWLTSKLSLLLRLLSSQYASICPQNQGWPNVSPSFGCHFIYYLCKPLLIWPDIAHFKGLHTLEFTNWDTEPQKHD